LDKPLEHMVATTPAHLLADMLIGGVLKRDVKPLLHTSSLLMEYLDDDDFLLRPLPNHLFQRDNSAWVGSSTATTRCPTSRPPSRVATCW
jgi:arginine deiminase